MTDSDDAAPRGPRVHLAVVVVVALMSGALGAVLATVLSDDDAGDRREVIVAGGGGDPDAAPDIVVAPAEDVVPGSLVEVEATGFAPGESIAVTICLEPALADGDIAKCDLGNVSTITAGGGGEVSTSLTARNPLRLSTGDVTCGEPERCVVAAAPVGEYDRAVGAPITFAGATEGDGADAASITATRSGDDPAVVAVEGARFEPDEELRVALCLATAEGGPNLEQCDYEQATDAAAGPDGMFTAELRVRSIQAGANADDPVVDCTRPDDRCAITVDRLSTRRGLVHAPIEG